MDTILVNTIICHHLDSTHLNEMKQNISNGFWRLKSEKLNVSDQKRRKDLRFFYKVLNFKFDCLNIIGNFQFYFSKNLQ